MSKVRTVTLELLRAGPTHNQLLSPLTPYLALCAGRSVATIQLPFEHREVLRQLRALGYANDPGTRSAQLAQTSDTLSGVLASIANLGMELAQAQSERPDLIHLRLVLSGAELALLPFEMARAPQGYPGEAEPLLLQAVTPIAITREVRLQGQENNRWTRTPRILFVTAEPPGVAPVPDRAHALALRRAIQPWSRLGSDGNRIAALKEQLTILTDATLKDIQEACAAHSYTHVHILAHGLSKTVAGEERFGLALRDAHNPAQLDIVDGRRLADALRTTRHGRDASLPLFVTLATCDSANQGSILSPGGSLAHELHAAGIPWVIGSQFPLSMRASVIMTEQLYSRLLEGEDPRLIVHSLRQQLNVENPDTHDWASLVVYARVPEHFDQVLTQLRDLRTKSAIDAAFERADNRLAGVEKVDEAERQSRLDRTFASLEKWLDKARKAVPTDHSPASRAEQAKLQGLVGSSEKRRANLIAQQVHLSADTLSPDQKQHLELREREALERACDAYLKASKLDLRSHWVVTQYLSMCLALQRKIPIDWLTTARLSAELDTHTSDREVAAWGHADLCELAFIAFSAGLETQRTPALNAARNLLELCDSTSFEVSSTRRQFLRYVEWWRVSDDSKALAAELAELLSGRSQD